MRSVSEGRMKLLFRAPTLLLSVLAVVLELFAMESVALCQASARDLDALSKASVIYIATVRKDGNQSTPAPVWFTVTPDRMVLIQTGPTTWKAKRIRRGSPVIVWIGKQDGPAFIGKAEITKDPAVIHRIVEDFPQRYLVARLGFFKPSEDKFDQGQRVAIKITPIRDLPQGFSSKPGTPAPSIEDTHARATDSEHH